MDLFISPARRIHRRLLAAGLSLCLLPSLPAMAEPVGLSLDVVTALNARGGEVPLTLDNRAEFSFDPDTGVLESAGTWIAQNRTGGNRLSRYSHKVENFSLDADQRLQMKSYECVEGTFGATILQNYCNHYRFGPNQTDDGGYEDDVTVGRPISLWQYEVSLLDWTGESLTVILSPAESKGAAGLAEIGLRLEFSALAGEDG